jgi:hypothetical protein
MKQLKILLFATAILFAQQTRNPDQQQQNHPQNNPPSQQNQPQPNPGDVPHQTSGSNNPDLQQQTKSSKKTKPKTKHKKQDS